MPTYTFRTRILSDPYKNIYDTYDNSNGNNSYWILIFLLIVLTLVAIFVGSIYNTQGYYHEGFEDGGASPIRNSKTLYFFGMENCRWCQEFKSGAWKDLQEDMKKNPDKYLFKIKYADIAVGEGTELAQKYKITSAPTLVIVDDNNDAIFKKFNNDINNIDEIAKFGNKEPK
jgi:thioredoxin-related protein